VCSKHVCYPFEPSVHFLGPLWSLVVLGAVCLCFSITLASLSLDRLNTLQFLRILLARNAVLGALTFLQVFRRRFSVLADIRRHGALSNSLEAYGGGVCIVDHEQRVILVNKFLRQRHGPHRPEQRCADYFGCDSEGCAWCIVATLTGQRGSGPHQISLRRLRTRQGDYYYAALSALPMLDEAGHTIGAMAFVTDVSEQTQRTRLLETQLAFSAGQLDDLAREREKWLKMITELGKRLAGLADLEALFAFVVEESRRRLSAMDRP
jgi:PAS domain-containing protein